MSFSLNAPVAKPSLRRASTGLSVAISAAVMTLAGPASASEAFDSLKGSWSGGGSVSFSSGESEKLRCTARYTGGGSNLGFNMKCASSSAQINLTGDLSGGSKVSGSWSENSYSLSGNASGSASGTSVRVKISGGANGYLTLSVSGSRHTIALSTQGSPVSGVNVSLNRR